MKIPFLLKREKVEQQGFRVGFLCGRCGRGDLETNR